MKKIYLILLVLPVFWSCLSVFDREPVANAGEDQTGYVNYTVVLSGTESYDPDGDELTYSWQITELPADSNLEIDCISQSDKSTASFLPDAPGTFTFTLVVQDSDGMTSTDTVDVLIEINDSPDSSIEGLHLSELLCDFPYAIELFNTTDEAISLSEYDILLKDDYDELIIPLSGTASAPAADYFIIHNYSLYGFSIPETNSYSTSSSMSLYLNSNFSLTLRFQGNPVDFIQVNSIDYPVPSGFTWNQEIQRIGDYVSRKTIDMSSPLDQQWECKYGTLGLANDSTGNVDSEVTMW